MLTARGTELERVVGLELGADDYVVKPFSGAEVIARMRAVLRRVKPAAPVVGSWRSARCGWSSASRRVFLDGEELSLSRKEFDLLAELVAHAGEVVTREDLISRVWDENWFGSTKTLGRAHRLAAREARRRRVLAALPAHGARGRLPVHGCRRSGLDPARAPAAGAGLRARAGDRVDARAAGALGARPDRRRGAPAGVRAGRGRRGDRGGRRGSRPAWWRRPRARSAGG